MLLLPFSSCPPLPLFFGLPVPEAKSLGLSWTLKREPGIEAENKMAKVRRSRRKFHLPAVKPNEKEKTDALMPNEVDKSSVHTIMVACRQWNIVINVK